MKIYRHNRFSDFSVERLDASILKALKVHIPFKDSLNPTIGNQVPTFSSPISYSVVNGVIQTYNANTPRFQADVNGDPLGVVLQPTNQMNGFLNSETANGDQTFNVTAGGKYLVSIQGGALTISAGANLIADWRDLSGFDWLIFKASGTGTITFTKTNCVAPMAYNIFSTQDPSGPIYYIPAAGTPGMRAGEDILSYAEGTARFNQNFSIAFDFMTTDGDRSNTIDPSGDVSNTLLVFGNEYAGDAAFIQYGKMNHATLGSVEGFFLLSYDLSESLVPFRAFVPTVVDIFHRYRISARYHTINGYQLWVDGVKGIPLDNSPFVPEITAGNHTIRFGIGGSGAQAMNMILGDFRYFDQAFDDFVMDQL
jgi:hypothetical protein